MKDPSDFWAALGVGVNIILGGVAFFAFKASRDSANYARQQAEYARQQAELAEKQTRVIIESARLEREQINKQQERERQMLGPSIYASLTHGNKGYSLMLVNGSQYPIVFEDIIFVPTNSPYPNDDLQPSFLYEGNPILTEDGKSLRRILAPSEGIEILAGGYYDWNIAFQLPQYGRDEFTHLKSERGMPVYVDSLGRDIDPSGLNLLHGGFRLTLPFAYIAPSGNHYVLYLYFEAHKWAEHIALNSSDAHLWERRKVFTDVWEPVTAEDMIRFSSPQP